MEGGVPSTRMNNTKKTEKKQSSWIRTPLRKVMEKQKVTNSTMVSWKRGNWRLEGGFRMEVKISHPFSGSDHKRGG